MKTITLTKGLPASGKTTWAREQQKKNPNLVRVNKDDLRAMLNDGMWSRGNEKFVLKVRDFIVEESLKDGKSVIVDDTNLHSKHKNRMWEIASKYNAVVQVKSFMDVTPQECVRRDALRPNPVGKTVIYSMVEGFFTNDISEIDMDKIWVISDTHFTHQMLIDEGVRPADYNEQIIKNWNDLVGKDDVIIHLGDVIFGYNKERLKDILGQLNGYKYLVKGNHDYKPDEWYKEMGFDHVSLQLTWGNVLFTHIPEAIPELRKYNIHGHLHGSTGHRYEEVKHLLTPQHILIALELNGYKPQRLKDLL